LLDERSTPGTLLLSASGPLAECYGAHGHGLAQFWQRALAHLRATRPGRGEAARDGEPGAALVDGNGSAPVDPLATSAPGERIGFVANGVWSAWACAMAPKYRPFYRMCYVHELAWEQSGDLCALVIPFQSDHAAIARHAALLDRFLAAGRTIAVFGSSRPE